MSNAHSSLCMLLKAKSWICWHRDYTHATKRSGRNYKAWTSPADTKYLCLLIPKFWESIKRSQCDLWYQRWPAMWLHHSRSHRSVYLLAVRHNQLRCPHMFIYVLLIWSRTAPLLQGCPHRRYMSIRSISTCMSRESRAMKRKASSVQYLSCTG